LIIWAVNVKNPFEKPRNLELQVAAGLVLFSDQDEMFGELVILQHILISVQIRDGNCQHGCQKSVIM